MCFVCVLPRATHGARWAERSSRTVNSRFRLWQNVLRRTLPTRAAPGRSQWAGRRMLPVWSKVLSATAEPEEYAERITTLLSCHYSYGRDKMLAIAGRTATGHQRKALAEVA